MTPGLFPVKHLRSVLGISQQDLAVRVGVSVRTVARWESGFDPSALALTKLQDLAVGLNLKGPTLTLEFIRVRVTSTGLMIFLDCLDENGKHQRVEVPVSGAFAMPEVPQP